MTTCAILLARGGSKGIPRKNIIDFCGKPLMVWTIEHCLGAAGIDSVWVSSDDDEILAVAAANGARTIRRPDEIAGDTATSESGWRHAMDHIEASQGPLEFVVAPQVTSPLRHAADIERGLALMRSAGYDSLFSCGVAEDIYFWQRETDGTLNSVNYDWRNRKRRQDHQPQYIENGSFYIFRPEILRQHNNRFGGRIGMVEMEFWKTFEIDSPETMRICAALMREFLAGGPHA